MEGSGMNLSEDISSGSPLFSCTSSGCLFSPSSILWMFSFYLEKLWRFEDMVAAPHGTSSSMSALAHTSIRLGSWMPLLLCLLYGSCSSPLILLNLGDGFLKYLKSCDQSQLPRFVRFWQSGSKNRWERNMINAIPPRKQDAKWWRCSIRI